MNIIWFPEKFSHTIIILTAVKTQKCIKQLMEGKYKRKKWKLQWQKEDKPVHNHPFVVVTISLQCSQQLFLHLTLGCIIIQTADCLKLWHPAVIPLKRIQLKTHIFIQHQKALKYKLTLFTFNLADCRHLVNLYIFKNIQNRCWIH